MARRPFAVRSLSAGRRLTGLIAALVLLIGSFGLSALIGASASAATDPSHLGTNPGKEPPTRGAVAVPTLSTAKSTTTRLPDGKLQTKFYPAPVNFKAADGSWQPINNTLTVGADKVARSAGNSWSASVGANAGADMTASLGGTSLSFRLEGAASSPAVVKGSTATYDNALPGVGLSYAVTNTALKETMTLANASAPSSFTFDVTTSAGTSLRANKAGGVDVLNEAGTVAYVLDPPTVADAHAGKGAKAAADERAHVSMALSGSAGQYKLGVVVDQKWLAAPERAFPVVVDPTVDFGSSDGESCEIVDADPNGWYCWAPLEAGFDSTWNATYRSMVRFDDVTSVIPANATVTDSYLGLYSYGVINSNSVVPELHAMTHAWDGSATWNTYDGWNSWPTAGADFRTDPVSDYGDLSWNPNGYWLYAHPGSVVQEWVRHDLDNNGLLLKAADEGSDNYADFASFTDADSGKWPTLTVEWEVPTSNSPAYSAQLDDHLALSVDAPTGNVQLTSNLLNYQGVGPKVSAEAVWNSLGADGQADMGVGWSTTLRDRLLFVNSSGVSVSTAPGKNFAYLKDNSGNFVTPPGANATLADIGGGSYTLTFDKSQEVWTFDTISTGPNSANGYLVSQADRNGNILSYTWNTGSILPDGSPELDSITDTQGRTITVGSPSGEITGYSDSTGRSVGFTTDGSDRTYLITDANAGVTTLHYSGHLIDKITTPAGNITTISYDGSNRADVITRVTNNSLLTGPQFSFTYNGFSGSPYTASTVVTDPNAHDTTYEFDTSNRITKVTDANGHDRGTSYSPNNDPLTLSNGLSQITTLAYDNLNNLTSIQAPDQAGGGSGSGRTSSIAYNVAGQSGGTSIPGYAYLPSEVQDAQGNATSFTYNTTGNVATITPPSGIGGSAITNHYQGDSGVSCSAKPGQLCSSVDGRGNTTTYFYDSGGNLTGITPPAPLGSTTITPDSLGRPVTVVDGKSTPTTTTYGYDAMDRITYLRTDGNAATACTTTDAAAGKCLKYVYDGDGNLTSRLDVTGSTTFTYDKLNRPTSKTPAISGTSSSVTYDGANNILTYTDTSGTVTYGYDPANQVTKLAENGGSCTGSVSLCTTFAYDNAGRRTTTTYPSGQQVVITYDTSGRQLSVTGKRPGGSTFISRTYTYGTGSGGSTDTDLRQSVTDQNSVTTNYTYDALSRLLTAADGTTTWGYSYDATGNRLTASKTGTSTINYGYNNANQLCWSGTNTGSNGTTSCPSTPSGNISYTYDGDGNQLTAGSSQSASYNKLNQTITGVTSGSTTTLGYADVGSAERTSSTVGGTTTNFVNGLGLGLTAQTASGSTVSFVRDPNGNLIAMHTSGGSNYYTMDALGSVLALTNSAGTTDTALYTYDPYGQTLTSSGTLASTNPFRYASGYQDASGNYHYGQRYYNPATGRWTQQDSISQINDPANANKYVYVGNDPINLTDPSGQSFLGGLLGGVTGFLGGVVCAPFTGVLGGAACGGAVGGLVSGAIDGDTSSGLFGAVTGFVGGAICGALATALTANPVAGFAAGLACGTVVGGIIGGLTDDK